MRSSALLRSRDLNRTFSLTRGNPHSPMGRLNIDAPPVCGVHKIDAASVAGIGKRDDHAIVIHDSDFEVPIGRDHRSHSRTGDRVSAVTWVPF